MIGQITDISFWHPHTGMFMLFTPVCVTALGLCVLMRPGIGAGRVAWVGFALGLGNLCYGAFIVGLPVVGLAVALSADRDRPLSKVCRRVAGQWGVLAAAALGPSLLWLLLLRAKGIVYYNHEVESAREFIWPMDALRIGGAGFLVEFVRRSVIPGFLGVLFREIVPYLLLAVGGLGGCVAMGVGRSAFGARERRVLLACALASAAFLPFILAMGLYISRIQWMAAAPVLVAAGVPILLALSRASGRTRLVIHILLVAAAVLPLITGIRKVTGYGLVRDELQAAAAQRAAGH
jgi:hypothetical protein